MLQILDGAFYVYEFDIHIFPDLKTMIMYTHVYCFTDCLHAFSLVFLHVLCINWTNVSFYLYFVALYVVFPV